MGIPLFGCSYPPIENISKFLIAPPTSKKCRNYYLTGTETAPISNSTLQKHVFQAAGLD